MTSVIRTEKLTKSYGTHRGIVDVDLEVAEGEIFGFLGPNGAGKTTTIRTLLDLIRPTSGRAFVFDIESSVDPGLDPPSDRIHPGRVLAVRPPDRWPDASTYFGNLRGGVDRAYRDALIERLDVDPSRRFKEYSKGNKQKIGLVIALQHRPELLLLDEPTSGLDPARAAVVLRGRARHARRGQDGLPVQSHPVRSRADLRPGGDHPGWPAGEDSTGRRPCATSPTTRWSSDSRTGATSRPRPSRRCRASREVTVEDHTLRLRVAGSITPVVQAAARYDLLDFISREPSLEETFLAQYGQEAVEVRQP